MPNDVCGKSDDNEETRDLSRLIRLPVPKDPPAPAPHGSWQDCTSMAARPVPRKERDEDEDDDEEEEKPRPKKKRPQEEEKSSKKAPAKAKEGGKKTKPATAEEEEEEPRERRVPKKGTRRYQLYVVNMGLSTLNIILIALFAIGGYASLHIVLFQLLNIDKSIGGISEIFLLVLLGLLPAACLVADVMFLFTPPKSDARGAIIAALTLHILALVFGIISLAAHGIVADVKLADRLQIFALGAANFSFWLGFLMMVSFLKQLYYYLGDQPAGNHISTLGLFFVIIVALGYAFFCVGATLLSSIEWLYMVLIPLWFLWDGASARFNLLLLRNIGKLSKRIERIVYPDFAEEEPKKG
jgi:hypothetical protein